ncbi:hypothetical protein BH11BAC1_BH11BAC1_29830 [soil metagenome]
MFVKLRTWTGTQSPGCFYIQSKGQHAGRPLKNPIRNCFAVYTDDDLLFEKVYSLFVGRMFERHIHGTCIPTIRMTDVHEVIEIALVLQGDVQKELKTIRSIDNLVGNLHQQIKLYKEIQIALCRKINS